MVPPRKILIQNYEKNILLAFRSKKQKSRSGETATGSQTVAHEQKRKKREEALVRERETKKKEEKKGGREKEDRDREEGKRRKEVRTKVGQSLVPVSALAEGDSVALTPQLAPTVLERAMLPADRQSSMNVGTDQLALKAGQC